jgi:hypothetical protein
MLLSCFQILAATGDVALETWTPNTFLDDATSVSAMLLLQVHGRCPIVLCPFHALGVSMNLA